MAVANRALPADTAASPRFKGGARNDAGNGRCAGDAPDTDTPDKAGDAPVTDTGCKEGDAAESGRKFGDAADTGRKLGDAPPALKSNEGGMADAPEGSRAANIGLGLAGNIKGNGVSSCGIMLGVARTAGLEPLGALATISAMVGGNAGRPTVWTRAVICSLEYMRNGRW